MFNSPIKTYTIELLSVAKNKIKNTTVERRSMRLGKIIQSSKGGMTRHVP